MFRQYVIGIEWEKKPGAPVFSHEWWVDKRQQTVTDTTVIHSRDYAYAERYNDEDQLLWREKGPFQSAGYEYTRTSFMAAKLHLAVRTATKSSAIRHAFRLQRTFVMTPPAPAPNVNPGVFPWTSRSPRLDNLRGDAAKCHGSAEELARDDAMSDNTRPPWPLRRAPRRDDVLPPPGDFNDPQPSDAPTAEETAARAALVALRNGLGSWLVEAAMSSKRPVEWRSMIRALYQAAAMCVLVDNDPIVVHTPPEIAILSHAPEPEGEVCVRCGLAVVDVVHPRALGSGEPQPEEGDR